MLLCTPWALARTMRARRTWIPGQGIAPGDLPEEREVGRVDRERPGSSSTHRATSCRRVKFDPSILEGLEFLALLMSGDTSLLPPVTRWHRGCAGPARPARHRLHPRSRLRYPGGRERRNRGGGVVSRELRPIPVRVFVPLWGTPISEDDRLTAGSARPRLPLIIPFMREQAGRGRR